MTPLAALKERGLLSDDFKARREAARDCWPQSLWWSEEKLRARTPRAVARPRSAEEATDVLRRLADAGTPIVPRGGGSGVCGAAIPAGRDCVVLDATGLDRIHPIEAGGSRLRVGAGVFGGALEEKLRHLGLSTGHSPASLAVSTVGGWIATASQGHFSSVYGGAADRVRSMTVALPDGRVEKLDGAGAWAGSEGTLGLILEAELELVPVFPRHLQAMEFADMRAGLAFVRELSEQTRPPLAARLYDGPDRRLIGPDASGRLPQGLQAQMLRAGSWLRRGAAKAWRRPLLVLLHDDAAASRRASAAGEASGARALGPGPAERWWAKRFLPGFDRVRSLAARGAFSDTLDAWAPWPAADRVYREVGAALERAAFWAAHASHAERGGVCLYFSMAGRGRSLAETRRMHAAAWEAALDACVRAGGEPNHHHGWGLAKRRFAGKGRDRARHELWRTSKAALDPEVRMNPDKLRSDGP